MQLTALEKKLVNQWQKGFPLARRPYAQIAESLQISEDEVFTTIKDLTDRGVLSRIGAVVRPNTAGASSLVAMQVPDKRLDEVAQIISEEPGVNHNYQRENKLNLWFVVTASDTRQLDQTLARIKDNTGCTPIKLPLKKAFHIDLGFSI